METTAKLENGQFDLQEDFTYCGVNFTCKSWGKGSTAHSQHIVEGMFNGELRTFRSSTRKQAKDMFKKMVRKHLKRTEALKNS
jgi:hypothetical protein